jgi:hypothetical protein
LFQKREISSKSPVFETPNRPAGEGQIMDIFYSNYYNQSQAIARETGAKFNKQGGIYENEDFIDHLCLGSDCYDNNGMQYRLQSL